MFVSTFSFPLLSFVLFTHRINIPFAMSKDNIENEIEDQEFEENEGLEQVEVERYTVRLFQALYFVPVQCVFHFLNVRKN